MKRTLTGIGMAFVFSQIVFCQDKPSFEVADIQLSKVSAQEPKGEFSNSRLAVFNATLKDIMLRIWDLPDDKMIVGAPAWYGSDRFDIVAKAKPDTPDSVLKVMVENLLIERFKLAFHKEDKVVPVYVLTVKKGTPKLDPPSTGRSTCPNEALGDGHIHRSCKNMSMTDLAAALPSLAPAYIDLPVVDQTGLTDTYDFKLEWVGRGALMGGGEGKSGDATTGLTIFEALDRQLGLKLEARKVPMPVRVIDHLEQHILIEG